VGATDHFWSGICVDALWFRRVFVKINTFRNWRSPKLPASISFARKGFQVSRGRFGRGRLASIPDRSIEMARGLYRARLIEPAPSIYSHPQFRRASPRLFFGFCFQRLSKAHARPTTVLADEFDAGGFKGLGGRRRCGSCRRGCRAAQPRSRSVAGYVQIADCPGSKPMSVVQRSNGC
jgi:hypothetical protein